MAVWETRKRVVPPPIPSPKQKTVTKVPLDASDRNSAIHETNSQERDIRVRRGETLYAISRRHGAPLRALIERNGLRPPYRLAAGTRLRIPSVRVYTVGLGDTVNGLSRRFAVSPARIIRINRIKTADYRLYTGQKLILPRNRWASGAISIRPVSPGAVLKPVPPSNLRKPSMTARPLTNVSASPAGPKASRQVAKKDSAPPRRSGAFQWPIRGKVLSTYGAKGGGLYNDGINIAARDGAPVRAAESGVVAYAGNELRGYGNLLLVRHSGGWVSAYAHTRKILVAKGQVVRRGQTIARVGRSGTVNRPQLHFELRRGPHAVNPLRYLRKKG
jgi:murein DD-endopeptidase MepM/ murein hydrolase activator NlpD